MITSYFKAKKNQSKSTQQNSDERSTIISTPSSSGSTSSKHTLVTPNDDATSTKRMRYTTKENTTSSLPPSIGTINAQLSEIPCDATRELLSNLTNESWIMKLADYVTKPSFRNLAKFIASERANKTVYPPPCDVFSALNSVSIDKVKVVIVGQDPYHQPNQGHGLAFSVRKGIKIPPSLRNIYKELLDNDNCGLDSMPSHGYLKNWCSQGVLLLNAVLTVRKNEANSHANRGWEQFTDEIIKNIVTESMKSSSGEKVLGGKSQGRKIIFLLWGKPASKKAEAIINRYGRGRHVIISTSHPSPLGATKTKSPFIGSKCFSKTNQALIEMGEEPIQWTVDGL